MLIHRLASWPSTTSGIDVPRTTLSRAQLLTTCAVIFLTALGIRLLYWQDNYAELARGKRDSGLQIVSFFYYDQAQRILDDGGILFPRNPVDPGDATVLTHPPGYSILMAAVFKTFYEQGAGQSLSRADTVLRVVQIVGDAASAVVIFLIAAELFPVAVAIIAAMLCVFSPHFAYYSLMLGPDSLSILPILLAGYFMIRAIKRPRFITVITAGAFVGLSCWLRSNALLLAPFLACIIPLLFERGKRLRYSLALIAGTVLIIAPIIIRNWIVFHQFVPLSVMAGLNLVEGIGDYDKEDRFGMPSSDAESALKDAEWHGRPDYAGSLWRPDGIERDKARFGRGLAVVRSNPGWFVGVMLRRMEFMLRYNDFRPRDFPHLTTAPALSAAPNFGHKLEPAAEMTPMWSSSSPKVMANGDAVSRLAQAAIPDGNQALQITGDGSQYGEIFSYEPIEVKKNTDYVLRLSVTLEQGNADVKIGTADPRIVLALVAASSAVKEPKRKTEDKDANQADPTREPRMKVLLVPFASGDNAQVRPSFYKSTVERTVLNVRRAEMFEIGPTGYLWTRHPRALIRGVQKNVFKTNPMRALIAIGIILLALARRGRVLAVLLIVPIYYLLAQSPLHTEYRYVLAIHYFLFVVAAATIYYGGLVIGQLMQRGYQLAHDKLARQIN
ncbi:MAG: glycosyltransferase family 39 protein [Acidobacteriota bacterium]